MGETYRGVVRDGAIVLLEQKTPLREGVEVLVTVQPSGPNAALIAALDAAPHVPPEWVDELERLIAEGKRPPARLFEDAPA